MLIEELVTRVNATLEHPEYAVTWFQQGQYSDTNYTIVPLPGGQFALHRPTGRGGNYLDRDYDHGGRPRIFHSEDAVCDYVWEQLTKTRPPTETASLPPAEELAQLRLKLLPGGSPDDPGTPLGPVRSRPYPKALRPLAQLGWTCLAAVWGAATVSLVVSLAPGEHGPSPSVFFVIATSFCVALVTWIGAIVGLLVTARSLSAVVVFVANAAFAALGGALTVIVGGFGLGWARESFWPWVNGGALVPALVVAVVVRALGASAAKRRYVDVEGMVARLERTVPEMRGQMERYRADARPQGRIGISPLETGGFAVYRRNDDRDGWSRAADSAGAPIVLDDEAAVSQFVQDEGAALTAPKPPTPSGPGVGG
ncbi:hypothetical protein GCM10027413_26190 [Conyzicola nivalis]|uniref:Uncharacterized protein n=1 Tax=Conyzicola nivalis TaxID=1477021 RepID=A0A916S8C3_9MICO|nr:hypothetical protein [Conyzicola nivalis]GGA89624.1 hypothetical protein GCM10010979_00420 [Conyzicola nivalis]